MSIISSSKLILGTVQLGLDYGINNKLGRPNFKQSCEILSKAFDNGITTLDTAETYGDAHNIIGGFHKINPSKKFRIITKLPHGSDLTNISQKVSKYLKDINVDRIDVLMFHSFDTYEKSQNDFKLLSNLVDDNLVNKIGVSVYDNSQMERLLDNEKIRVVQFPFNLFDNVNKRGEQIAKLKEAGRIVHSRSAFLQGMFFKNPLDSNPNVRKLSNELIFLNKLSDKYKVDIGSIALNYCICQKNIDQVIIGTDSLGQLSQNIESTKRNLEDSLFEEINSILIENSDILNPSLWE
jgi:aryl-alcohol dehydrogenase-like predicted oxidoreductase